MAQRPFAGTFPSGGTLRGTRAWKSVQSAGLVERMGRCTVSVVGFVLGVGSAACGPSVETEEDCTAEPSAETDEDCNAEQVFVAPGCTPPDDAVEVEPACYERCDSNSDCGPDRVCVAVYHDPCHQASCHACGGTIDVCLRCADAG